jgi:TonB-dependent Receptor Plug Domain
LKYPATTGLSIEGLVTSNSFTPEAGTKVRLSALNLNTDVLETKTDSKGRFVFANLDYEDTLRVKIEALKSSGENTGLIRIEDFFASSNSTFTNAELRNTLYSKSKIKENTARERLILREKNKARNKEQGNSIAKLHGTADDVLQVGSDALSYNTVFQYMKGRVSSVDITGDKVLIRGISTNSSNTDPLFLLDGTPIDASAAASLSPTNLATIEVLKGPETSIYGVRGGNGVIAFYSRRNESIKQGVFVFDMKGYQKVVEFYVPSSNASQYKPSDYAVPRTLYWDPQVITNEQGIATVKFPNAFKNENTQLTIEGLTNDGEIIYYNAPAK